MTIKDRIRLASTLLPPNHRLVVNTTDYNRWTCGEIDMGASQVELRHTSSVPIDEVRMAHNDGCNYIEIPLLPELEAMMELA